MTKASGLRLLQRRKHTLPAYLAKLGRVSFYDVPFFFFLCTALSPCFLLLLRIVRQHSSAHRRENVGEFWCGIFAAGFGCIKNWMVPDLKLSDFQEGAIQRQGTGVQYVCYLLWCSWQIWDLPLALCAPQTAFFSLVANEQSLLLAGTNLSMGY